MTASTPAATRPHASGTSGVLVGMAVGMGGGVVGLLPWLTTGARLPLQNLSAQQILPADMPLALLPINQYYVSTIAAVLIVGGLVAGLFARALARRDCSAPSVAGGLLVLHIIAVLQTLSVLRTGLGLSEPGGTDPRARLYLTGMLVGTLVVVLAAQGAFWLSSRRSAGPVSVGLLLSALPLASWIGAWSAVLGGPTGVLPGTGQAVRWLPAVVATATLVWAGLRPRPRRRLGLWVLAAAVLLVVPPAVTAATTALGTRSLQGDPAETVAVMVAVLRAAVFSDVVPAVAALSVAALGTSAVALYRRHQAP